MKKADPFTGEWRLSPQASQLPSPPPVQWVQRMQAEEGAISITEEMVTSTGATRKVTLHAKFDGQYYPVRGSPLVDAIAYHRIHSNAIYGTGKRSGKVTLLETATVSADGDNLILEFSTPLSPNPDAKYRAVFEKASARASSSSGVS